ncbi:MAG: FAD-dependent oxidoreductase [Candidatus Pacebacteria bacterium]|nr:FAD-dependent oxidoreductase [Candidatus Paceibacterota bacterium]MBP9832472.1 FAD-dependent oxidoreductase [Candidatus Paceibacterota bacterium]
MYDVAIIGGGPGGSAAGVYAARKLLKTVLITDLFGGQSVVSEEIQNWIGTPAISGADLAKNLEAHVRAYAGSVVDIVTGERVLKVASEDGHFTITTKTGKSYNAKTILVTAGGSRRKLDVPGAHEFDNKGVTYCASCDGPLFGGSDVVVIGGGNAGFETAAQLLAYAKSVTLLHRGEQYAADPVTVEKVLAHPNMRGLLNAETLEITGEKFVNGLRYKNLVTGAESTLAVSGIFVEIGMVPSTEFVDGLVELDQYRRIIIDHKTQKTSCAGIWAAGDCTSSLYHQNNIAAGDAVKALEDIYVHLKTR